MFSRPPTPPVHYSQAFWQGVKKFALEIISSSVQKEKLMFHGLQITKLSKDVYETHFMRSLTEPLHKKAKNKTIWKTRNLLFFLRGTNQRFTIKKT